jgi:hypothetical protein
VLGDDTLGAELAGMRKDRHAVPSRCSVYWIPAGVLTRSLASLSLLEWPRSPILAMELDHRRAWRAAVVAQ